MDLFIVRHAWAGRPDDVEWPDDDLRPLTDEGRERFAQVASVLADRGFEPEVIGTSPLVRCRQTADVLADILPGPPNVVELPALEPGSDLVELMAWTLGQAKGAQQIAWVGHAPDVGRLAAVLIGQPGGWIRFAKGSVAAIRFPGLPEVGQGELRWLVTAKVLGC